jgi:hypothetical protein
MAFSGSKNPSFQLVLARPKAETGLMRLIGHNPTERFSSPVSSSENSYLFNYAN